MSSHRLLVVCALNVCRSPYLAFRIASQLAQDARGEEWHVADRGTDTQRAMAICDVSAEKLGEAGSRFAASHVSRKLTATDVKVAHLVLTATTAERSRVAQVQPDARGRTFTVREALALGAAPIQESEVQAATVPGRAVASLRTYSEILHGRRGTVDLDSRARRIPFLSRTEVPPLDIPDLHIGKPAAHARLFGELDADARTLVSNIEAFLDLVQQR